MVDDADLPDYPDEWTPEQRLTAYWYATSRNIEIRNTDMWPAILADAERTAQRRHNKIAAILTTTVDDDEVPF